MEADHQFREDLSAALDIVLPPTVSEEEIIRVLGYRIGQLLAGQPDQLFSMLYRLDISERKIKAAMELGQDVAKKIAVLVYERQMEKMLSRKQHRAQPPDEDLAW